MLGDNMAELDLTQMREDIDAEIARATEKERVLQSEIDDIVDTVESAEYMGKRLDAEIEARKTSDSTETAARIAADNAEIAARQAAVASEAKKRHEDDELLNNRINNIIAHGTEGSLEELVDIRLGSDDKTYETAGDAVRGQVGELQEYVNTPNVTAQRNVFDIKKFLRSNGITFIESGDSVTFTPTLALTQVFFVFSDIDHDVTASADITIGSGSNQRFDLINANDDVVGMVSASNRTVRASACKMRVNFSSTGSCTVSNSSVVINDIYSNETLSDTARKSERISKVFTEDADVVQFRKSYIINSSGEFIKSSVDADTMIIKAFAGLTIHVTGVNGYNRYVFAYDKGMNPIEEIPVQHIGSTAQEFTYTVPSGVEYIGFTSHAEGYSAKYADAVGNVRNDYSELISNHLDSRIDIGSEWVNGYLMQDGVTIDGTSTYYKTSGYIPVYGGKRIAIVNEYTPYQRATHCYDADKNWIGGIMAENIGGTVENTVKTPYNTAYIRIATRYPEYVNVYYEDAFIDRGYFAQEIVKDWCETIDYDIDLLSKAKARPIVTFIDDDTQSIEAIERYHDVCVELGIKGGYAMLDNKVSTVEGMKELLLQYEREGFHCTTHGYSQSEFYLNDSNRDLAACEADLVRAVQDFKRDGFIDCMFWCTPYGVRDADIQALAKKIGMNCIVSSGRLEVEEYDPDFGRWGIDRCSLQAEQSSAELTVDGFKGLIDKAVENNGWLLVTTHMYEDAWKDNLDTFREVVNYAKNSGATILPLNAAWREREPIYRIREMF